MASNDNALCLPAGVELEEYLIDGVLGKGGFAITYSGMDQRLKKRVAIKELLPDGIATRVDGITVMAQTESLQGDYEWAIDSFIKEAQTIAGFEHPNIVRVLRFFRKNGTAYMVMPLIDGSDLKALIKQRGTYAYADVLNILPQLLGGLSVVHRADVLHRDIKPENIYITTHGVPILIDFGAARQQIGGKSMDVTSIITPGYAPIEQYSTDAKYQGAWSDIYSMAACVYHMITGKKPVPASERSDASRNRQPDPLTPLTELQPEGYPHSFLVAVDQALQMGEAQRPQSVEVWLPQLGIGGGGSMINSTGTSNPTQPRRRGGNKVLLVSVILLIFAGLVGGGVLWYVSQDKKNPRRARRASTPDPAPTSVVDDGRENVPMFTDLEVAIRVGEYDKALSLIRELDRKTLPQEQRVKLTDLRDLRDSEMKTCAASVFFRPSPSVVSVYIDGKKIYASSGRYTVKGIGKHNMTIRASGYEDKDSIVEVLRKGQLIDLGIVNLRENASARLAREKAFEQKERERRLREEQAKADAARKAVENKEGNLKKELVAFVNDYYRRLSSNDVDVVGGLYANYVDYEYVKGHRASRNEVKRSFSENLKRWPIRSYKSHGKTSYKALNASATRVIIYFAYSYSYSNHNGRKAKGSAYDTVTIEKKNGDWQIVKWEQGVKRTRNDLKGL